MWISFFNKACPASNPLFNWTTSATLTVWACLLLLASVCSFKSFYFFLPLLESEHTWMGTFVDVSHMWCWNLEPGTLPVFWYVDVTLPTNSRGPASLELTRKHFFPLQIPQAVYGFIFKVYVPHFVCISAGGVAKFGPNLAWTLDGVLIGGCQLFLSPCAWGRLHYLSNLFNLSNLFSNGREEGGGRTDRQTDKWNEAKKINTLIIWKDAPCI